MSENGRQPGQTDSIQANGQSSELPEDAPVERIISDSDAAREVAADVPEDDPELEYKLSVYRYEEQPEDSFAAVDYSRKGETPAAPKRGRSIGDYLTIILLVGIPIAIAAILLAVNQSNQQSAQQSATALPTPRPVFYADQLAIVEQNVNTLADGTVTVDITLANKGQDNVQTVNILVRLLDDKGGQVGNSGIITIQGIAPGGIGKGEASIKPPSTFAKADILINSVQTDHQPTIGIAPTPTVVGPLAKSQRIGVNKIVNNPRPNLEDDLDTSTPLMTPTDAESAAMAGRPYPKPRASALILTVLLVGFMLVVFAAATFFIYNNGQTNGLAAAFAEPSPTPAVPAGSERVYIPSISASPVVSSENVVVQVTVTPVPSVTPLPSVTPVPPMNITVTDYYTGANLSLTVQDEPGQLATPAPQIVGAGTPAAPTPAIAPIQSVTLKIVFFNKDGNAAGSWVASVGPIPLGGSKVFNIAIPTKPGIGKWDGTQNIVATVYAIVTAGSQ